MHYGPNLTAFDVTLPTVFRVGSSSGAATIRHSSLTDTGCESRRGVARSSSSTDHRLLSPPVRSCAIMTLVTGESNRPDPECPALTNKLANPGTLPTWQCHNDDIIRPEAKQEFIIRTDAHPYRN